MLYFFRTTNTCRPTNRTILQCELYIYIYIYPRFQHCLEGGGAAAPKLEVPSYFLVADDNGTSRSLCIQIKLKELTKIFKMISN